MYEPVNVKFRPKDFGHESAPYLGKNSNIYFVRLIEADKRLKLYVIRKGKCSCIYWEPYKRVVSAKVSAKELLQKRGVKFRIGIPNIF